MAYCGAACMQLSDQEAASRCRLAEKVTKNIPIKGLPGMTHKDLGVYGRSWFEKELYYVLPSNFFLVPFAHALLYGVVKDFWDELLPSATGQSAVSGKPGRHSACICMYQLALQEERCQSHNHILDCVCHHADVCMNCAS